MGARSMAAERASVRHRADTVTVWYGTHRQSASLTYWITEPIEIGTVSLCPIPLLTVLFSNEAAVCTSQKIVLFLLQPPPSGSVGVCVGVYSSTPPYVLFLLKAPKRSDA